MENTDYLSTQLITYLGNKRSLLPLIGRGIERARADLGKDKIVFLDLFSGSGVVSRYAKQYASKIIANDIEYYAYVINSCYLANKGELDLNRLRQTYMWLKEHELETNPGFICELYAPADEDNIKNGERVFYTRTNALYIDNMLANIDKLPNQAERCFFIAPLLSEVSIHVNTAGVFKGFYKNASGIGAFGARRGDALNRIKGRISLPFPVLSDYDVPFAVYQEDANKLADQLETVDVCYIDPPYNQHPYGSNYFMLNNIAANQRPDKISQVSGIPVDWKRSAYNKKNQIAAVFHELIAAVRAHYILVSFNNEGFLDKKTIMELLGEFGPVEVIEQRYNTFRGSRNLNRRDLHVTEYLFILKKKLT